MIGLGFRREMRDWDWAALGVDFFEVAPENWLRRDRTVLHQLIEQLGAPVFLHGVSLNLGGTGEIAHDFVRSVRDLMRELNCQHYSDHLAASGDAHQLYDLFPIPFTENEARRVAERIARVQDILGCRMAIENSTWYTNVGEMNETEFLARVVELADCQILLDINNIDVNHKNHGGLDIHNYVRQVDMRRVSYIHVAGHEFDPRFGMYIDTHSQAVEPHTAAKARQLQATHGLPILLEWDNDIPSAQVLRAQVQLLRNAPNAQHDETAQTYAKKPECHVRGVRHMRAATQSKTLEPAHE